MAVLAASAGVGALAPSAGAAPTVGIRVDAGTSLGTVPSSGFGLNTGYGDEHMGSAKATSLMKAAGVRQLRYPGGSGADDYHWKTHTYGDGSGWIPSNTDFDHFMAIAKKVGAQPILTANYGSGTPKEAADWVKYANVDKGYGVKYWEIGNEVYGNGHYGKCEPPRDTPFPTYWGIRSLTALAQPGDTMVKSSSRNSSVAVHAVRSGNGRLNVMLINKSPQNAAQVSLSYAGFTPAAGAVTTVSYAKGDTSLTTAKRGTAGAQKLPPYSITTLQLKPASGTAGADKPSPAPTPTAATPLVSAAGATGTRAQAENGAPVGRPTPSSSPSGPLASTGVSNAVTYSALGGLLVIAAGGVLALRGRRRRALHRR
ncbi:LPXTG cell wall anchor domain-containing protein [Streptomyces variegatus]|uniref:LPXTG cell wall anchor domain-containing protein n=1 Tax=Streptomyces variegatus TaxID=284040 RepID=UPI003C2EB3E9